ncbi:MAG TPA: hypothetical protein V6C65_15655 [Allocoleopsis sp.]
MARYTSLFRVAVSLDRFRQLLVEILRSCSLDIIYSSEDYLVAREVPGQVSYTKLVTVEVMIEQNVRKSTEVQLSFVVKNEELPLQNNNHCRQIFNLVNQSIAENRQWQLIASAAS